MQDIYLQDGACIDRLSKELETHGRLIVGFDFDDTIYDYHKKGYKYDMVINLLKECKRLGFILTLITDMYEGKKAIIDSYMSHIRLQYDYINETPSFIPFGHAGKPYYNILLDDRAGLHSACFILHEVITNYKFKKYGFENS